MSVAPGEGYYVGGGVSLSRAGDDDGSLVSYYRYVVACGVKANIDYLVYLGCFSRPRDVYTPFLTLHWPCTMTLQSTRKDLAPLSTSL